MIETGPLRFVPATWQARLIVGMPWLVWAAMTWLVPSGYRVAYAITGLGLLSFAVFKRDWTSPKTTEPVKGAGWLLVFAAVIVWWVYHPVFFGGWMNDDPRLIRSAIEHGWLAHFVDPRAWRALSGSFFTPLLPVSLGLDLHIFGLTTEGFYFHHMLSFSIVLTLVYVLLTGWISPLMSAVGVLLFAISAASAGIVQQLMTRHYVEGLLWLLLAVLVLLRGSRTGRINLSWLAAGCALLSILCKEIYVPIVALVTIAPLGLGWRRQARLMSPIWFAVVIALVWRLIMLGSSNAWIGYGSLGGQAPVDVVVALRQLAAVAGIGSMWQALTCGVFCLFATFVAIRASRQSATLFWSAFVVVMFVSVVPVLGSPTPRYLWIPTLMGAAFSAIALDRLIQKRYEGTAMVACAVLLASGFSAVATSPLWIDRSRVVENRKLAEFVLRGGDSNSLVMSNLGSPLAFQSLTWLRRHYLGLGPGPRVCADVCVCGLTGDDNFYHVVSTGVERIQNTDAVPPRDCGNENADLAVEMHYEPSEAVLSWRFDPYRDGQYLFAGTAGEDHVSGHFRALPAEGKIPLTLHEPLVFVLRYESPQGWHTDSPYLRLIPGLPGDEEVIDLQWQRDAGTNNTGVLSANSAEKP